MGMVLYTKSLHAWDNSNWIFYQWTLLDCSNVEINDRKHIRGLSGIATFHSIINPIFTKQLKFVDIFVCPQAKENLLSFEEIPTIIIIDR